ncbi:MAG: DUF1800 domain-containing protein [Flavobacteriales bacterium]|jgi:hypothetical protein|nr:MAG: DUF1800 domain-containing protein [Flavobacteriales bacterium]
MPLTPYTGPFGRAEQQHLLRRTLFGCSNADLAHFQGQSLAQVVDALLTFTNDTAPPVKTYWNLNGSAPDPNALDPQVPFGSTWVDTPRYGSEVELADISSARLQSYAWWRTGLMVHQDRNIREKMALFWYNHMPTQVFQVFNPRFSYEYDQLLRTQCLGNFRQLVHDVTVSGAMLIYLNGFLNTANAPDENYARELMELFTLGEGSGYTEEDVQAAARVLTGWTVRETDQLGDIVLPYVAYRPSQHVTADKQFSAFFNNTIIQGQGGQDGGEAELNALLDMIMAKEEVSRFICRELYRFFVHGEIDAATEAQVIEPLAELFRAHMGAPDQLRTVMQALLTSDHFFSAQIRACMIMSPADLVIGSIRKLDMPMPTPAQVEAQYRVWRDVYFLTAYSGQELLNVPNVAGWPAYYQFPAYDDIWLDTATYPARNNSLAALLFSGFSTPNNLYQPESRNLEFKVDFVGLVGQFSDPMNPNALVSDAAELMFAVPVSLLVRTQLKISYLLLGQLTDSYWSDAYELYVTDPNTTDMTAQLVPSMLLWLFLDMAKAAETQLH